MTHRIAELKEREMEQLVATFGEARLVRVDGRLHLREGSMADRMEALEWLSLFLPDEAPRVQR